LIQISRRREMSLLHESAALAGQVSLKRTSPLTFLARTTRGRTWRMGGFWAICRRDAQDVRRLHPPAPARRRRIRGLQGSEQAAPATFHLRGPARVRSPRLDQICGSDGL